MSKIKGIFERYNEIKEKREISISQVKKELDKYLDKIVLYGSGSAGIAFLHYLHDVEIFPVFFADGDESKWHKKCEGLEIIPPQDIIKRAGEDCLVILTINTDGKNYCKSFKEALRKGGPTAVHKKLADYGCRNLLEYTFFRRCFDLFSSEKYNLPSVSDVYLMEKHLDDLEEVYNMLDDDLSRETFSRIIEFRMIDDSISIPTFEQVKEYFAYDIYKRIDEEIFVDGGAYTGTTLDIFLDNNLNRFRKYFAIEPDKYIFEKLEANIQCNYSKIKDRIVLVNSALYDSTGDSIRFFELRSPGSFVSRIGNCDVNTIKIDSLLKEEECTFIKMNIEGSEIAALNGAEWTIEHYSPVMAIMGYHKTKDLWEIPKLILKMNSEYRLYLRSYMNQVSFMYYAVPRERLVQ